MKIVTIAILLFFSMGLLQGEECNPSLLSIGGGYFDAGKRHSGGLFQVEYRFGGCYFCRIRPLLTFLTPEFRSVFFGAGVGIEIPIMTHLSVFPSFSPGLYCKGKGKDLGYPLEFRSAIEVAYEWDSYVRFGAQLYHISNASLSHRNPGANALVLILAIPFR